MPDDDSTCPTCREPNVHPRTTTDGLCFRRCPACSWSWFTRTTAATTDGEAT